MIPGIAIGNVLIIGLDQNTYERALDYMKKMIGPLYTAADLLELALETENQNGTTVHETITYLSDQNNNY